MKLASWTPRCVFSLLVLLWIALGPSAQAAEASSAVAAPSAVFSPSFPPMCGGGVFGSFTDGILGNRARMVQMTCIIFAVGVLILVTSTRKH